MAARKASQEQSIDTNLGNIGLVLTVLGSLLIAFYQLVTGGVAITLIGIGLMAFQAMKRYDEIFVWKEVPSQHRLWFRKQLYFRTANEQRNRVYWFGVLMLLAVLLLLYLVGLAELLGLERPFPASVDLMFAFVLFIEFIVCMISAFMWPSEKNVHKWFG